MKLKDFYLTIDLRSLGLYRIAAGCLLIYDWLARWPSLEAFYTSFGVLPIEAPLPKAGGEFHFSLLDSATSLPMVQAMFWLGLVCYVCFLIGWRTRLFHILSFLFFISVSNRNIMTRDGSDVVMTTMLMWSMFLPLGKRFSLDAVIAAMRAGVDLRTRPATPTPSALRSEPSLAAFVIVCQIGLIYYLTAWDKYGPTWIDGTALYHALHIDYFTRPLGAWARDLPLWFIKTMTWGTLGLEFIVLPLLLVPVLQPLLRRMTIVALTGLHLGIWLLMDLGSFPFVMIGTFTLLLSSADCELLSRWALRWSRAVTVYYDDTCGFCYRCCQLLAIADRAGKIRFIGNTDVAAFQHKITREELDSTVVVFDDATLQKGTKAAAAAAVFRALPAPFHVFRLVALPGLSVLSDEVYDYVASRRYRLSEWLGFTACGIDRVKEDALTVDVSSRSPMAQAWQRFLCVSANAIVALVFVAVLWDNYNLNIVDRIGKEQLREPALIRAIIQCPQLEHAWQLFAPDPTPEDGWWVIDGVTESGKTFDPLTGRAPDWDRPSDLRNRYDRYWRKYLSRIWERAGSDKRLSFGQYITRKNHREQPPGRRLVRFDIYFVLETTLEPGTPEPFPTKRVLLWHHECFGDETPEPPHVHTHDEAESSYERGTELARQFKIDDAIKALRHATEIRTNYAEAWMALGAAYNLRTKYTDAARAYETGVALKPDDVEAWYALGVVYVRLRDFDKATEIAGRLQLLDPARADQLTGLIRQLLPASGR